MYSIPVKAQQDDLVKIGKLSWSTHNLSVCKFRNGDPVPEARTDDEWNKAIAEGKPAWCYYNNDSSNDALYGKLYNWYAVNDPRGLAPDGWHIPTNAEWYELQKCLGSSQRTGCKLKSTGTIEGGDGLWKAPNTGATNESGFSALPSGYRGYLNIKGTFGGIGSCGIWWSSTEYRTTAAWCSLLDYKNTALYRGSLYKNSGYSVRCIKD